EAGRGEQAGGGVVEGEVERLADAKRWAQHGAAERGSPDERRDARPSAAGREHGPEEAALLVAEEVADDPLHSARGRARGGSESGVGGRCDAGAEQRQRKGKGLQRHGQAREAAADAGKASGRAGGQGAPACAVLQRSGEDGAAGLGLDALAFGVWLRLAASVG